MCRRVKQTSRSLLPLLTHLWWVPGPTWWTKTVHNWLELETYLHGSIILSSQVVSLPLQMEVANFCAAMDTLINQDVDRYAHCILPKDMRLLKWRVSYTREGNGRLHMRCRPIYQTFNNVHIYTPLPLLYPHKCQCIEGYILNSLFYSWYIPVFNDTLLPYIHLGDEPWHYGD